MEESTENHPIKIEDINVQEKASNGQDKGGNGKRRQTRETKVGIWQVMVVILAIVCLILLIVVIVLAAERNKRQEKEEEKQVPTCGEQEGVIDISEPEDPSVFQDLTPAEVKGLTDFLYSNTQLNLVRPGKTSVGANYMYTAELYVPKKNDVISYLDGNSSQKPTRDARVMIFMGNQSSPVVQEILVSSLPNPTQFTILKDNIPFIYRPYTGPELLGAGYTVTVQAIGKASDILQESYGGSLIPNVCGNKCLSFKFMTQATSAVSGEEKRKIWYQLFQDVDFFILHPVDFAILVNIDKDQYSIEKVWYNGRAFDSLDVLKQQYDSGQIAKQRIPFPVEDNTLFSKLSRRGEPFPETKQRPPLQVEPDGKRYSIKGRHVTYMNWDFDFRMSTSRGPQIYDIRYQNKRIVYELSLQELGVFYSGHKPTMLFGNYFDSIGLLGGQSKGLVPGVDCPAHATYLPASHLREGSETLETYQNVFCVFEQDTGMPLRRHHTNSQFYGLFYEGMPGHVLILRTIITVINYDYVLDFIFYQNGVIETKAVSTGYILATTFAETEKPFGARVHKFINGNLHHHLFNFKVDMDINGVKNSYDTMDITTTEVPNSFNSNPNANMTLAKFERMRKSTEEEAAYKFNFDFPKYHIFYNNGVNDTYGNPKSYRVLMRGMSKQILPEAQGNEPAGSWARYQMAVTKQKESERYSSSPYASFDAQSPVVDFQSYIGNESIVDEDLVAWISMGVQHIPHTEDLPVTHTPGMDLSFFLLPYNYFPEDPSMASRDSIRIEPKVKNDVNSGIRFIRDSNSDSLRCFPKKITYQEMLQKNPGMLFEN